MRKEIKEKIIPKTAVVFLLCFLSTIFFQLFSVIFFQIFAIRSIFTLWKHRNERRNISDIFNYAFESYVDVLLMLTIICKIIDIKSKF